MLISIQHFLIVISAQSFEFWVCRRDSYFLKMERLPINTPFRSSKHT